MIPQSATQIPQPSIEVYIEELVLHGLPLTRGQGSDVQAAVETELARLLTDRGLNHSASGATPHLSAGSIQLTRDNKPAHLGHQIARTIYSRLTPTPASLRQPHSTKGESR